MTESETLEIAKAKIRAEKAQYMRNWRKKNPDKVKASRERYERKKLDRVCREVENHGKK